MPNQGNSGRPPKLLEFPTQGNEPIIHSFWAGATVNCGCGKNPDPIVVHFIPGLPLKAFCKACRTEFVVARISYDFQKDENPLSIAVGAMEPKIVTPV